MLSDLEKNGSFLALVRLDPLEIVTEVRSWGSTIVGVDAGVEDGSEGAAVVGEDRAVATRVGVKCWVAAASATQ